MLIFPNCRHSGGLFPGLPVIGVHSQLHRAHHTLVVAQADGDDIVIQVIQPLALQITVELAVNLLTHQGQHLLLVHNAAAQDDLLRGDHHNIVADRLSDIVSLQLPDRVAVR